MKPLRDQIAERIVECNLVSHSLAFPIADVVLRVIGNGAIKALEEENTRLTHTFSVAYTDWKEGGLMHGDQVHRDDLKQRLDEIRNGDVA
jgi:hypothetical protein